MSDQRQASIPAVDPPSNSSARTSKTASPTRSNGTASTAEKESNHGESSNASPTRQFNNAASTPSAAAVQRALLMTKTPATANDSSSDTTRNSRQKSASNVPQWPVSPRLKSPPPVSSTLAAGRRLESDTGHAGSSMRRLAPVSVPELGAAMQIPQDSSKDSGTSQQNIRVPGRGASAQTTGLETVAEGSVPSTSSFLSKPSQPDPPKAQSPTTEHNSDPSFDMPTTKGNANETAAGNFSRLVPDKAETAPSSRAASVSRPAANLAKRSITSLTGKAKPAVEPLRTMTVETETVTSNPSMLTDRGRDGGSVRAKPSSETIRPKKDKRKPSRKTPSLHAGTNSSKADIFEAKVASAVDEADSSDSDETFVYESNPPEPRHSRHHSRTPSATSVGSQLNHHGSQGRHGVRHSANAIGARKSMKFSNSMYGNQLDIETAGDGRRSTRANSTTRHHQIGRHGRSAHASVTDTDSTFGPYVHRSSPPRTPPRTSRPNSPRTSNGRLSLARKSAAAGYDIYDDGADDERAPLIGSVRSNRTRHSRRPNSGHARAMHFEEEDERRCWPRFSGCFFLGFIIALVCVGVGVFVMVLNRPLMEVEIIDIENVLASEQELMLDLHVRAINPNLFTITVNDLDVNLFAESPYVGTAADWHKDPAPRRVSLKERRQSLVRGRRGIPFWYPPFHRDNGVDEGTDPIDDPPPGSQKMLLGRIFKFDSPLAFDATPVRRNPVSSVGEIRLPKPGNETEVGGSERWERVLQHPFDLIVRGVIKYQLPLGSSTRSAKIGNRVKVKPGGDSNDGDKRNRTFLQVSS